MDLTHIFLTVVVIFLAHVEVGSTMERNKLQFQRNEPDHPLSMQSYFRRKNCLGGNLLKIHTHQCTNGLCKAKLDGSSTQHKKTRFRIINVSKGKKCIEFRNEYALKVVNSTHVAFKKQGCQGKISSDFQFHEVNVAKKYRVYKYYIDKKIKCLGLRVDASCHDATLHLIDTKETEKNSYDRRCYFENP